MQQDLKYMLAFHKIFKTSLNKYFMKIQEKFGSFRAAWQNYTGLDFLPKEKFTFFLEERKTIEPQDLVEAYYRQGISAISRLSENFPAALLQISDVPCILYYCGQLSLLKRKGVAIVGSRRPTTYGLTQARLMAGELCKEGLVIISGLARGIDTAAHQGTLEKKGATIAVLGSGLDCPYPPENNRLLEEISRAGLLLSEYPPGTEPLSYHFPARNRIISGLSLGVLVIEARARSGSLITCDFALEQGKDVFALPGPVTSPNSIGPLRLIQQGAKLVLHAQDVLAELGYEYQNIFYHQQQEKAKKIKEADKIVYNLVAWEPVDLKFILKNYQQKREGVLRSLHQLEKKGLIKQLPGEYYVRI